MAKLNAFQMKGLRRLLKFHPTFIDRSITNQRVLDILRLSYQIRSDLFFHTWFNREVKLFGHILRSSPDDPLKQVLFEYNIFFPKTEYRRPGKPRTSWLLQAFKDAFEKLGRAEEYDYDNPEHQNLLYKTQGSARVSLHKHQICFSYIAILACFQRSWKVEMQKIMEFVVPWDETLHMYP